MEQDPHHAIEVCRASHRRLITGISPIGEETARRPSRLQGWTVAHLLAHLALHAEGNVRRLEGAMRGEEVARYPGGPAQRDRDIEEGARRRAPALVAHVVESSRRLEETWDRAEAAGWPNAGMLAGDRWPITASPLRRLREVEVHHVDLALGYEPGDWPEEYLAWELAATLERLPARLPGAGDRRRLLTWLMGRSTVPGDIELSPWP